MRALAGGLGVAAALAVVALLFLRSRAGGEGPARPAAPGAVSPPPEATEPGPRSLQPPREPPELAPEDPAARGAREAQVPPPPPGLEDGERPRPIERP